MGNLLPLTEEEEQRAFLFGALQAYHPQILTQGVTKNVPPFRNPKSLCIIASQMVGTCCQHLCSYLFNILDSTKDKEDRQKLLCSFASQSKCNNCLNHLVERIGKLTDVEAYLNVRWAITFNQNVSEEFRNNNILIIVENSLRYDQRIANIAKVVNPETFKEPYNKNQNLQTQEQYSYIDHLASLFEKCSTSTLVQLHELVIKYRNYCDYNIIYFTLISTIDRRSNHQTTAKPPNQVTSNTVTQKRSLEPKKAPEIKMEKERNPKRQKTEGPSCKGNNPHTQTHAKDINNTEKFSSTTNEESWIDDLLSDEEPENDQI